MNILVTGGAGYVGTTLIPMLLEAGHGVRTIDWLMYGGQGLLPCFKYKNFEFIKGDAGNEEVLKDALKGIDFIIHLAGIVGYPACKKNPELAERVNVGATKTLMKLRSKSQPVIYASTGSNYGAVVGQMCTEDTPLRPLSIYGRTKTEAEKMLLEDGEVVVYRFATAFGVSPRLRLDLLINDFCYQALKIRNLIVYEKTYKRTFIHVRDMGRAIIHAIDNYDSMKNDVYNCGHESMNYSKEDIALLIKEKVPYYLHFAEVGKDEDQRNYEVSYEKIRSKGFNTSITVQDGIDELLRALETIEISNPMSNV